MHIREEGSLFSLIHSLVQTVGGSCLDLSSSAASSASAPPFTSFIHLRLVDNLAVGTTGEFFSFVQSPCLDSLVVRGTYHSQHSAQHSHPSSATQQQQRAARLWE